STVSGRAMFLMCGGIRTRHDPRTCQRGVGGARAKGKRLHDLVPDGANYGERPNIRLSHALKARRNRMPTKRELLVAVIDGLLPSCALQFAANLATSCRANSCARLERENWARAPCRLYCTQRSTRVALS